MPHKKAASKLLQEAIDPRTQRFSGFRQEHKSFVTLAFGHAGKPKILDYSLDALISTGALHTAAKTAGTIFSMDPTLARSQLMYCTICCCVAGLSYFAMPEGVEIKREELEGLAVYLNVFIPFILGLYISLCLSRWWHVRTNGFGAVLDASQNVALLMSAMFPGPEWTELHDQVLKWGHASVSLIVLACRCKDDVEGLGPTGQNLLNAEELELVSQVPLRARAALMWTWILMLNCKVCVEQSVPEGKYRDIAVECVLARNGISIIWTFLRTQLPFAYVHLLVLLVNVNNLVVAIKSGFVVALAIKDDAWSQIVNQVLFLFVVPPLYQGLLSISHVIHDPFGEDLLDFPVMAFQEYTNEAAFTITDAGYLCPALATTTTLGQCVETAGCGQSPSAPVIESTDTTSGVFSDTVIRMQRGGQQNIETKRQVIASMYDDIKNLEASAAAISSKVEGLETMYAAKVASNVAAPVASSGGWCQPYMAKRLPPLIQPVNAASNFR